MLFGNNTFVHAWVLWFIPMVWLLGLTWLYFNYQKRNVALTVSALSSFADFKPSLRSKLYKFLPLLSLASISFLLVALARPQSSFDESKTTTEGIDIVIAMDVSSSMLARDFKPNRLDAAKEVALNFVDGRPHDRIGLVVFSGESFTQCPVTIDHAVVKNQLKQIKNGLLEDGTAIGMGLATSVQRLKESESKSKVVILLTDGVNNKGLVDPATSSDIAKQFGVRCYTIGVGNNGQAYTPVAMDAAGNLIFDYADVQIDEPLLRDVANKTGGKYFRATDNKKLKQIFQEIDQLERTKINVSAIQHRTEKYLWWACVGALLFVLEWLLHYTFFRTIS